MYIIFDLDDTVLYRGVMSERMYNTLKRCQKQGHKIIFNTARSLPYSLKHIDSIQPDYAILNGGALIVDGKKKVLFSNVVEKELVNKIVKDLLPNVINFSVESTEGMYSSDPNYKGQNSRHFDFNNEFGLDCYKLLPQCNDFKFIEEISNKYDLEYTHYLGGNWHRLTKKGSTKWTGVLEFLKLVNGSISETICFGDDIGDLEMIQKAGKGVAMANSVPDVLKNAPYVTLSVLEDGVAVYLEKYVLGE